MSSGVSQVSEHTFEIGSMGAATEQASPAPRVVASPAPSVAPQADASPPPQPASAPLSARQLLVHLKARRKAVRAELASKKRLEQELAQLDRLIRAATTELDNVRRLRAAG